MATILIVGSSSGNCGTAKHFVWRKRTLATPPPRCFRPLRRRVRVVRSSCFGWPRLSRQRASPQIQPAHISRQKMCRGSGLKRACGRHRWCRGSWRESRPAEAKNRSGRSRVQQQQQEGRWPAGRRALAEVRSWQLVQLCGMLIIAAPLLLPSLSPSPPPLSPPPRQTLGTARQSTGRLETAVGSL